MSTRSAWQLRSLAFVTALVAAAALILAACSKGEESGGEEPGGEEGETQQTVSVAPSVVEAATTAFPVLITELEAVDTAYAAGNAAEATTHLTNAQTQWETVTPAISARETSEVQLLFENLSAGLDAGTSASDVHDLVTGMVSELNADIKSQLG